MQLDISPPPRTISPVRELGAFEVLCSEDKASFKTIADKPAARLGSVRSDFVPPEDAESTAASISQKLEAAVGKSYGLRVHGATEYPE